MTKDERFLIELYHALKMSGDLENSINPMEVAKQHGYKELLAKNILKGLRQANLIKIYGPEEIIMTERGVLVVHALLNE